MTMDRPVRPLRSVLYMPGSNARALEKARTLPADALILDLEDAVAPEAKDAARAQVGEAVRRGFGRRMVAVRINALSTPWGEADLEAAAAAGPDAVLVTKAERAEDVLEVGRRLARLGAPRELQIWAMMETPLALLHAGEIAGAGRCMPGSPHALRPRAPTASPSWTASTTASAMRRGSGRNARRVAISAS